MKAAASSQTIKNVLFVIFHRNKMWSLKWHKLLITSHRWLNKFCLWSDFMYLCVYIDLILSAIIDDKCDTRYEFIHLFQWSHQSVLNYGVSRLFCLYVKIDLFCRNNFRFFSLIVFTMRFVYKLMSQYVRR